MKKFSVAFLIFSRIEFVFFQELFRQVVGNSLIDLESADVLNNNMRKDSQRLNIFAFNLIFVSEKLHD